ncbi:hypothetical protein POTOM_061030 [Populus tomentosa]|uniref:Uncharacterized protein n=1 Tax=Populus tomentosa TaxID=118781 RepID=A0A8X7XSL2_POPTO|nr:hypothetical protein POTOM_061030 [Populus tomentosa]
MVAFLLVGLGPDYDPFMMPVTARVEPLSMKEIYYHLLSHELRLEHHQSAIDLSITRAHYAAFGGNSFFHSHSGHNSIDGAPPFGQGGHIALDCYNRYNDSFSRDSPHPSSPQANLSVPSNGPNLNWPTTTSSLDTPSLIENIIQHTLGTTPSHSPSLSTLDPLSPPPLPAPSNLTLHVTNTQMPHPSSTHPMTTHAKNLITKPKIHTNGIVRYPLSRALLAESTQSAMEPTCYSTAMKNPN